MTVGVLGLFRPKELRLGARWVQAGSRRLPAPAVARAEDGRVTVSSGASPEVCEAVRLPSGPVSLGVPGKLDRTYQAQSCVVRNVGGVLQAVIEVGLEEAVAVATASEMPEPGEGQKAQAVAARSYYAALAPRHGTFDFCDTTHCQLFQASRATAAAEATRGLVLRYQDHLFGSMYFRSCGGRTLTAEQVGLSSHPYPYFSVECPVCRKQPFRWQAVVTEAEAAELPSEKARLALGRKYGWNTIASNDFTKTPVEGGVRLTGVGHGHGLGLCQRGARRSGAPGFRSILAHYFPGTELTRL